MNLTKISPLARLKRMTPGQMLLFCVMAAVFLWFILACMVFPILNLLKTVFVENGKLSLVSFQKLSKSPRAMKALKNSFILAPTLSLTVGFVGISIVLITEYFDIKGASILRLGYMTTLIYGGVTLVSGYKFIYSNNGVLTNFFANIFPNFNKTWFTGYWAVLFVMTFSCTSNHMIFLRNAMRAVDFQTVEAARNMGASQWTILRRVVLPVLLPSLFAVTILTFITGLCAMSAPLLVGGKDFQTINPMIQQFAEMTTTSAKSLAATLSLILGAATMLLLAILTAIERRGHYMSVSKVKTKIVKQKINNPVVNVLVHIYAYVLFVIYVVPVVLIVLFSFSDSAHIQQRQLDFSTFSLKNYAELLSKTTAYKPFLVSIIYSALAAVIVGLLVVIACRYIQKRRGSLSATTLEYSLMIPWLLPSTMIALSLMLAFNQPRWYMFNKPLIATLQLLLIGYVMVLAVIFAAFEWTQRDKKIDTSGQVAELVFEEEIEIPITEQPEQVEAPPPPEAPSIAETLTIVDDDSDVQQSAILSSEETGEQVEIKYTPTVAVQEEEEDVVDEQEIFEIVEEPTTFPGGDAALMQWLSKNIKYPAIAQENGTQGRVTVRFVVERDGSVSNAEVIRGVDPYLDKEALRVVNSMPKWNPGKQRGKAVRTRFTLPVTFRLQ